MAWKKSDVRRTPYKNSVIVPLVRERIRIPQPNIRPLDIHARDLIKKPYVSVDYWWYTLHRRGVRREKIGDDPLEKRAVPRSILKGTLPERILYQALVQLLHLTPGIDFDFQSSQDGGRMELGGIVADFLFQYMKIVIQVQGPTHTGYLRSKKDEEQVELLAAMGYTTYGLELDVCYNEGRFEKWLRDLFNLGGVGGGSGEIWNSSMMSGIASSRITEINSEEEAQDDKTYASIYDLLQSSIQLLGRYG